jgi:hypothetical protein
MFVFSKNDLQVNEEGDKCVEKNGKLIQSMHKIQVNKMLTKIFYFIIILCN